MAGFTHRPGFEIKIFQKKYFSQKKAPVFAFLPGYRLFKAVVEPPCAHSQFNIFRALRREPRGQKPPNTKQSLPGIGVGSIGPTKQTMGRSPGGFFLKAAQNTVLGYYFPGFSRGLVHYFPIGTG